jgi:transcription elongation factor Elf1|tara:strand:- start:268 stop:408 length:141 start_codon:yes stop_codon:yes gene_type:complete
MEHIHCGTDKCCGTCEQENEMSIKELMEEIEKLKERVKALEEAQGK